MVDSTLTARIAALGIDYRATFVPKSTSRNRHEAAPTLNWRVSLTRNGVTLETDYMQGIGHVPGYRELPKTLYYDGLRQAWADACETGKYPPDAIVEHRHERGTRLDLRPVFTFRPLPAPALADVLYSLVLDAGAWRMTFDEWCGEFGYDTDSRKAHAMYSACSDLGLRLVRMLGGHDAFAQLEEAFRDY